ncbi:Cuticle Protein CPR RR Uncl [Hyalella azteca]|uniref:Cuticle Protein CPR RR Uncl n=1 Tax=Hyalella azteca TaxID=294128 RepID=A0A6A0GXG0_HYAAZ|nr:cuticle protein CP575 [Hyalella azteca]KAA0192055.1 Cuticle Protein CPR RR Uncl [Hyalella azteca]
MKTLLFALFVVGLVVVVRAGDVIDLDLDDFEHNQDGDAGHSVTGEYKWTSPEGQDFVVQYVADDKGFRIVNSNAVPVNSDGVRADGAQGDLDGDSNERDD